MSRNMRVTCRRLNSSGGLDPCVLPMIAWLVLVGVPWAGATTIVDFEDLSLPAQSAAPGDASQTPFVSRGVSSIAPGTWITTVARRPGPTAIRPI